MKTRIALLGLVAVLVASAVRADEPTLKEFTSKTGGFTILLPDTPKEQKQGDQNMFVIDNGASGYMVSYQDIPNLGNADAATLKKALESGRDAAVKALNGKLASSKEVKLGDYPGLEFQMELTGVGIYRARIFAVKERLFQVVVIGPKDFTGSKTADKVLNSFKVAK